MPSACSPASTTSGGRSGSCSGSSGARAESGRSARAVNPHLRESDETRPEDVIFEGYELDGRARPRERGARGRRRRARGGRPRGRREAVHARARSCRCSSAGSSTADARLASPVVSRRGAQLGARVPRFVRIRIGHSPDPDDAFMFWALTTDLVDTRGHEFEQVAARHPDAEPVGARGAARGDGDLARRVPLRAGGLRAAAARREHRLGLRPGRSSRAGPITREELYEVEIVVPGALTTSFLALRLFLSDFPYRDARRSRTSRRRSRPAAPRSGCSSTRAS